MSTSTPSERMGSEKVGKLLWEMSSQTTFALLVYAVYSLTDTYFLSVGINSLAAAGASIISPVLLALGGVATTVGAGGASIVSRALGERNPDKAARVIANTLLLFWAVAILISILGVIFIEPLVRLFGATETVAPYAVTYGRIIFIGAVTSTGFSAIVRADGNVRYSTLMWIIPVSVNIVLCWLFIMVLHIGVAGAAFATITGQAISTCMSLYFFFFKKNRSYQIKAAYFKPEWPLIGEVLLIGFPSLIKNLSLGIVVIVMNNLLKVVGGDTALGVFAIVSKLYSGLITPQSGIVQGMQPIVGYNYGQQKFERVRKTLRISLMSSFLYGLLICGICLLFPAVLIGVLSNELAVITEGQTALRLISLAFPLTGIAALTAAYFQSLGKARQALILSLGGVLVVKLPVLFLLSRFGSLNWLWASEAISEGILCLVALGMLRYGQKKLDNQSITTL